MSVDDLIASLDRKRQELIDQIWQQAETAAAEQKENADHDLAAIREKHQQQLQQSGHRQRQEVLRRAAEEARRLRLLAEQELAERLRNVAETLLPDLRGEGYATAFEKLAAELPSMDWKHVRVHPGDADAARRLFASAEVEEDAAVSGGLLARTGNGRIEVDNTLERRLSRAWGRMLPAMIRELRDNQENNGPAQTAPAE